MRRILVIAAVVAVALATAGAGHARTIPGQYIVVLEDDARAANVATAHTRLGAQVLGVYGAALKGYAARLTPSELAAVRADDRVAFVEPDRTVYALTTQSNPPWGLDRIDQRSRTLSRTFTYFNTGAGVRAYVIDTGIRFNHSQFGGRAVTGFDAVNGGPADDCNGHGTHVAGTIGGSTYGVAKGVTLVGVRVLGCNGSGSTSGVIAGVNWVTGNHQAGQPAVANMSLGGGASSALDNAVRNSIADGVSYAVAAGNGNIFGMAVNACNSSPARVGEAMTISATDSNDRKASWANFGSCVDWFAPGVSITSAWYTSTTATRTISGTSMATPHTAGVAALYLQGSPGASPATVRSTLFNLTTKGVVTSSSTTNNHLLFTNF
ncbi:MAG TPA: S8 family peptidase [Solirubrobacteraceae bacterium]|nr:S8 family peptidase [Solirubrobacteraceae bacterium]